MKVIKNNIQNIPQDISSEKTSTKYIIDECPICYENRLLISTLCNHNFCNNCKLRLDYCAICRKPLYPSVPNANIHPSNTQPSYLSYLDNATRIFLFNNYETYDFSFSYFSPIHTPVNNINPFDFTEIAFTSQSEYSDDHSSDNESNTTDF